LETPIAICDNYVAHDYNANDNLNWFWILMCIRVINRRWMTLTIRVRRILTTATVFDRTAKLDQWASPC